MSFTAIAAVSMISFVVIGRGAGVKNVLSNAAASMGRAVLGQFIPVFVVLFFGGNWTGDSLLLSLVLSRLLIVAGANPFLSRLCVIPFRLDSLVFPTIVSRDVPSSFPSS